MFPVLRLSQPRGALLYSPSPGLALAPGSGLARGVCCTRRFTRWFIGFQAVCSHPNGLLGRLAINYTDNSQAVLAEKQMGWGRAWRAVPAQDQGSCGIEESSERRGLSLVEKGLGEGTLTGLGSEMQGGEVRPQRLGGKGLEC